MSFRESSSRFSFIFKILPMIDNSCAVLKSIVNRPASIAVSTPVGSGHNTLPTTQEANLITITNEQMV